MKIEGRRIAYLLLDLELRDRGASQDCKPWQAIGWRGSEVGFLLLTENVIGMDKHVLGPELNLSFEL